METDENDKGNLHAGTAIVLIILSVLGAGIGYVLSIVSARILGPQGFEQYVVAIATICVLAAIAEAGVGKYALKAIPAYTISHRWGLGAGYIRFSLATTLGVSVVLAAAALLVAWSSGYEVWTHPLGIAALFLPAIGLSGVGVDFVMANRAAIAGSLIARLIIPGTTLFLLIASHRLFQEVSAGIGVLCFGIGSITGALLCVTISWTKTPKEILSAKPEYSLRTWIRECAYYASISFMMSWMLKISVLILEVLPVGESQVGLFAAALETGCLILLMSKSTDKLFQPGVSIIIEEDDWQYVVTLRRKRHLLIGTGCGLFMIVVLVFGQDILGLYGAQYKAGYPALCFVALGCCVWTQFSMASAYLRFVGQNRFVVRVTILGAIAMAVLTAILGIQDGANGAGVAFCIAISSTALVFWARAGQHFRKQLDFKTSSLDSTKDQTGD